MPKAKRSDKKWCGHIILSFPFGFWLFKDTEGNFQSAQTWKFCPTCGTKRPEVSDAKS